MPIEDSSYYNSGANQPPDGVFHRIVDDIEVGTGSGFLQNIVFKEVNVNYFGVGDCPGVFNLNTPRLSSASGSRLCMPNSFRPSAILMIPSIDSRGGS